MYGKWGRQGTKSKLEKGLKERVAYLQGLAAGVDFKGQEPGGRVWGEVLDMLGEMARQVDDLGFACRRLEAYMECLDDEMEQIWEQLGNGQKNRRRQRGEATVEVSCSRCGETVVFDAAMLAGDEDEAMEVYCPLCGEVVFAADLPGGGNGARDARGARAENWIAGTVPGSTGSASYAREEVLPVTDAGLILRGPEVESMDTEGRGIEEIRRGRTEIGPERQMGTRAEEREAGIAKEKAEREGMRQAEGMRRTDEMAGAGKIEAWQIEQMRRREQAGATAADRYGKGVYDI